MEMQQPKTVWPTYRAPRAFAFVMEVVNQQFLNLQDVAKFIRAELVEPTPRLGLISMILGSMEDGAKIPFPLLGIKYDRIHLDSLRIYLSVKHMQNIYILWSKICRLAFALKISEKPYVH
jgi:hypothetical protein